MLYTSKESSEHVKCRFRLKKYDLLVKKWKKLILKIFFSKGGPFDVGTVENFFFHFSKFQILIEEQCMYISHYNEGTVPLR